MPIGATRPDIPESAANSASQLIDLDALWDFDQAHTTLDRVEAMFTDDLARARTRRWLERGRVFNSSRQPDRAIPLTSVYQLLSQDPWLVENEPARLERLKQSGEQAC